MKKQTKFITLANGISVEFTVWNTTFFGLGPGFDETFQLMDNAVDHLLDGLINKEKENV